MNLKKKAVHGIKWSSIGTIGRALFQLLQVSILTRYLPKEDFGLVAMAVLVIQFSNIFLDMGLTSAILHFQNTSKKEYSSIFWLNIFVSIFIYIIVLFLSPLISKFYNQIELNSIIPILGINILLVAFGRQHKTIMQKEYRFREISIIEVCSFCFGLITAIIFVLNDAGIYSLIISTLAASTVANLLFFLLNFSKNSILLHFKMSEAYPFLKIGSFNMGSTLLDFFSREVDILIIGKVLGPEKLGVYSLCKQIIIKVFAIINPIIFKVFNPLLSSIQSNKEKLKQVYFKLIRIICFINFPVYICFIFGSKMILFYLYGNEYASYNLLLSLLAFSYGILSISTPVGSLQIATGRTDIGFLWTIVRVLVTPPIIFIGAKISLEWVTILYACLTLFLIVPLWRIQIKPMINVSLKTYLLTFFKPVIIFLISLLVYLFIIKIFIFSNIILLNGILNLFFGLGIYTFFTFLIDKNNSKQIYYSLVDIVKSK